MAGRFQFNEERQLAAPDGGQELLARLDGAFRPAMLLRFEAIHVHRQLGRSHHVRQEDKAPAGELCAIAQIEIFAKRVMLPATGVLDTGFPPQAGCAVKVEKAPTAAARGLFQQQVAIQKHRLHPGEQ